MSRWHHDDTQVEHQEAGELLPWFVTGRLEGEERERVGRHLESCADCREEADRCRELADHLRPWDQLAPTPHPAQLDRLLARLDEVAPGAQERRGGTAAGRWPSLPTSVSLLRWIVVAEAAALVLVASALWRERASVAEDAPPAVAAVAAPALADTSATALAASSSPPAAFRTLSDPALPSARPELRVVFAADASEAQLRALLRASGTEIVGGPSHVGAYRLAVRGDALDVSAASALAELRRHPVVRFAEPVAGSGVAR